MGETVARVRIRGTLGSRAISAVVDTGATNTTIDKGLARQLGIVALDRQEVVLANGKSDVVGVGSAEVEIEGIKRVVPIFIYDSNLIGLTTLEAAGLRVNPVTRKLERVPGKLVKLETKSPVAKGRSSESEETSQDDVAERSGNLTQARINPAGARG